MKQRVWLAVVLALFLLGAGPSTFPYQTWDEVLQNFSPIMEESCANDTVVVVAQNQEWRLLALGKRTALVPILIVTGRFDSDSSWVLQPGTTSQDPLKVLLGPLKDSSFVGSSPCQTMQNVERLVFGHPA